MGIKLLILTVFFLFFGVSFVFAIDPPNLISPANNSTISSGPKLIWEPVAENVQYRVLVDDESSIKSPYIKSYYLTNTNYSPQLSPGTYYWKVGSKDNDGTWFWSTIWSFVLSSSILTPSPTSTPTPSPTSSPTSPPSTSFIITNIPSQINSNQSFNILINLSLPNNPNSNFYLKGAFKKSDGSNYFGQTKTSSNWVKNGSVYSSQFSLTTDASGNWSGNLEVKPDSEDLGFSGTGDYVFKLARYTQSGSGPTWSNETNINIEAVNTVEVEESPTTPQSDPTSKPSNAPNSQPSKSILTKTTTPTKIDYQVASIAGASSSATPSGKIEIKSHKQTNYFIWTGILLIFAGISSIGYIYIRKNEKISIKLKNRY